MPHCWSLPHSVGVRNVIILAALVSGSALASDPESTPLVGPWRVELSVAPVVPQVNGLFVEHVGTSAQVAVVVAPHLRVFVSGAWNWRAGQSQFAGHFLDQSRIEGPVPSNLLVSAAVHAGTEFVLSRGTITPLHFAHRFELSMVGFAGGLSTRVGLKPEVTLADGTLSPATTGDTGWRPTIGAGIGVRFEFLERFSLRVDLRESFFSSRVQTVNGCGFEDLRAMDNALRGGRPVTSATLTAGCHVATFDGTDADTGLKRSNDVPLALGLVRNPSAEWVSLQALQVSLGVVF